MASFFEPDGTTPFDPVLLFRACVESGAEGLLLDRGAIPDAFFDLSSGIAGELLHQLSKYRLRLAGVVPDLSSRSQPFQDFVREVNRGTEYRFFATREEAVDWLRSRESGSLS